MANFLLQNITYILKGLDKLDVSHETLKQVFGADKVENHFEDILEYLIKDPEGYRKKVLELYANEKNEDREMCKKCGGKCCLQAPCHFNPQDFETLSYKYLKKLLKEKQYISVLRLSSNVCQSCFREIQVNDPYFYILRIRTNATGIAAIAREISKDDHCMMWTQNGCKLSYDERPMGARLLIPKKDTHCQQMYGVDECFDDWKEHQDVLKKLYKHFEKRARIASILRL